MELGWVPYPHQIAIVVWTHHKFINAVNKLICIVLTGLDTHTPVANIGLAGGARLVTNLDAPRLSVGLILEAN